MSSEEGTHQNLLSVSAIHMKVRLFPNAFIVFWNVEVICLSVDILFIFQRDLVCLKIESILQMEVQL